MARIGIDARYGFREQRRGIGNYVWHLVQELGGLAPQHHFYLYLDPRCPPPQTVPPGHFRLRYLAAPVPTWFEQVALPRAARRDRLDLLHGTANAAPLFCRCPTVLTLHDVIDFHRSRRELAHFTPRHRVSRRVRTLFLPAAARRARAVLTVSEHSRGEICALFRGLSPSRVRVVPQGITALPPAGPLPAGVAPPYLLFLGAVDPRKNVAWALASLARALDRLPPDLSFVVVGSEDPELFIRAAAEAGIAERTWCLGFVPPEQLSALYHDALAFVYPSLAEGFGLPPLEAMAAGTPVLSSNATSLPEVVGSAALLFSPRDPNSLVEQLVRLLHEPGLREELGRRGAARAQAFTWERTARETLAVYEEVLAKARRV